MKDKEALQILKDLKDKYPFTDEEEEALREAIGLLSWTSLYEGRIRSMKKKKMGSLQSSDEEAE